jgi:excisionase family DNA binding protein
MGDCMNIFNSNERAPVLTLGKVAQYLPVQPSAVYRLLKRNLLPAFKLGYDWRFYSQSVDRWRAEAERNEGRAAAQTIMVLKLPCRSVLSPRCSLRQ